MLGPSLGPQMFLGGRLDNIGQAVYQFWGYYLPTKNEWGRIIPPINVSETKWFSHLHLRDVSLRLHMS